MYILYLSKKNNSISFFLMFMELGKLSLKCHFLKFSRYIHMTHCVVSGKSDPLMLELQGIGIGPQVQLVPDFHELGNVNLYSTYKKTMLFQNTGELEVFHVPIIYVNNLTSIFEILSNLVSGRKIT